jgi:hypothetical protein
MKKQYTFLLAFFVFASLHCNKQLLIEETAPVIITDIIPAPKYFYRPNSPKINFEQPLQGQKSYYVQFHAKLLPNDSFGYYKDTLVVEVAEVRDSLIWLEEHFTSRSSQQRPWYNESERTLLVLRGDSLDMRATYSYLFHFYGRFSLKGKALYLTPTTNYRTTIAGKWFPSIYNVPMRQPTRASVESVLELFGKKYDNLLYHADSRETAWDGNTWAFFYSKKHGIVRSYTDGSGGWGATFAEPRGWDLLP